MASLLLFNPENDVALALGRRSYTPDKGAVAIRRAGCMLPLWWAEPGDELLLQSGEEVAMAQQYAAMHGLSGTPVMKTSQGLTPMPWGWSHYTRRTFLQAGVDETLLPSPESLDALRMLSHRRTSVAISRHLGLPEPLMPVEASTLAEALEAVDSHGGNAVVKLPWSSSGRGVIYSNAVPRATFETYVAGMIRRQGSVTIEPRYDRVRDFAMLFHSDGREAAYRGLSTFATDNRGFYAGNVVAPQSVIAERIGIDTSHLTAPLCRALNAVVVPHYSGWIGVDMLIYRNADGSHEIAPCIEVNLRMTMGVAAMLIAARLPQSSGPQLLTLSPSLTLCNMV